MSGILRSLSCTSYPGKYTLYRSLRSLGLLSGEIDHRVGPYGCIVPADQFYFWKICGPENYQLKRLMRFSQILNEHDEDFVFFDLGADVGVVSIQIRRLCPKVCRIVAFEPNKKSFPYLEKNLSLLDVPHLAIEAAASNFDGISKFSFDPTRNSDHSGHLGDYGAEEVKVVRVDSCVAAVPFNVAVKIDVEGEERAALDGATGVISRCKFAALFLEIHPTAIQRSKISPEEIFSIAEGIRPFHWFLSEDGLPRVERSRKFFEQFSEERQYDVIGITPG